MANTDRTRKLIVRSALITSTTIATLIGAQNLAMLDTRDFQNESVSAQVDTLAIAAPSLSMSSSVPETVIVPVAPAITVLRQSGNAPVNRQVTSNNSPVVIQPPAPQQNSVPDPIIVVQPNSAPQSNFVAQPRPQRSRSSR